MLLVKTKIGLSKIHGIGLFADEQIIKGTRIWEFNDALDRKISIGEFLSFPELTKGDYPVFDKPTRARYRYRFLRQAGLICFLKRGRVAWTGRDLVSLSFLVFLPLRSKTCPPR